MLDQMNSPLGTRIERSPQGKEMAGLSLGIINTALARRGSKQVGRLIEHGLNKFNISKRVPKGECAYLPLQGKVSLNRAKRISSPLGTSLNPLSSHLTSFDPYPLAGI